MQKIKISAVSYLNTKPFIYGIENSDIIQRCELELDVPSMVAKKLLSEKVDIGLVPVAVIPELKNPQIITDYCIGAEGPVASVLFYSEVPLSEVKTVYLDYQSRTSVALTKVLAAKYWKINPEWKNAKENYELSIKDNNAGVVIGDRAFTVKDSYPFVYDLAEEWIKFTGLPFVFACWVANKPIENKFIADLNNALKFGVQNMADIIPELNKKYPLINAGEYLKNNISFALTDQKRKGMELFLKELRTI